MRGRAIDHSRRWLDRATALGDPVRLGASSPDAILWTPMDEKWKKRFDRNYPDIASILAGWASRLSDRERTEWVRLRRQLVDGLLAWGGDRVLLQPSEPDVREIVRWGQLWLPSMVHLEMFEGEPCECHGNSVALWDLDSVHHVIATGYGLSSDGVWRQHSWVLDVQDGELYSLLETTVERVAYFGFVLDAEQTKFFVMDNG